MPLTRSSHREFAPLSDEERARLEAAIALIERIFTKKRDALIAHIDAAQVRVTSVHSPAEPAPKVEE